MSIPLDRLYHFIENIAEEIHGDRVVIYRFWPHGSKKLSDFSTLKKYSIKSWFLDIKIFCADQEPLDYNYYERCEGSYNHDFDEVEEINKKLKFKDMYSTNLKYAYGESMHKHPILLHSEKRSNDVTLYNNDIYIPVYYWSHALIARDWFRFAQHITQRKQVDRTFLIYNRAWSGTREYRLRFAELLVKLGLQDTCKTTINPIEPELGIHYKTHLFKNSQWQPQTVLEDYFPISNAHSHYSADFDIEDYEATDIEVVLETLFDDSRLHLTEKALRPIACGQPFILAGTHGSLEYLRSYGFKTFDDIWDESYDTIEDPEERLFSITDLMKQIADWEPTVKEKKLVEAQAIADYNRQYFFSNKFFNFVVDELKNNLKDGLNQPLFNISDIKLLIDRMEQWAAAEEVKSFLNNNELTNISEINEILKEMKSQHQKLLSIDK